MTHSVQGNMSHTHESSESDYESWTEIRPTKNYFFLKLKLILESSIFRLISWVSCFDLELFTWLSSDWRSVSSSPVEVTLVSRSVLPLTLSWVILTSSSSSDLVGGISLWSSFWSSLLSARRFLDAVCRSPYFPIVLSGDGPEFFPSSVLNFPCCRLNEVK